MSTPSPRLHATSIAAYALPALPLAVVVFPSYAILPGFYAQHTQIPLHLTRVARHLRLCADIPELAAPILGLDPLRLDPAILRAAARLLVAHPPRDH